MIIVPKLTLSILPSKQATTPAAATRRNKRLQRPRFPFATTLPLRFEASGSVPKRPPKRLRILAISSSDCASPSITGSLKRKGLTPDVAAFEYAVTCICELRGLSTSQNLGIQSESYYRAQLRKRTRSVVISAFFSTMAGAQTVTL
jgi:hypothetical protein